MSELAFLSVDRARAGNGFEPVAASPLRRALEHADWIRDLSLVPKLEARGDIATLDAGDAEVVPITRRRALAFGDAAVRERLREQGYFVTDVTGALAGLELRGKPLMRRLTDLDLDELPAVGAVARVPALVLREGESFRLFVPQEYGHYLVEVVIDAAEGLT